MSNKNKIKSKCAVQLHMSLLSMKQLKLNFSIIQSHLNYSYFDYSNPSFNVG